MWGLAAALGDLRAKVVRRRAEGDTAPVEVTPQIVAGILGAPASPDADVAVATCGRVSRLRRGVRRPTAAR